MEPRKKLNIDTFIFDPKKHQYHIPTFLEKASKAHGDPLRTLEWFHWKFFGNPFGDTVLACASHEGELVGCLAFGMQPYIINGTEHLGALQFENFVDPQYQRMGIFTRLLNFMEEELEARKVGVMLNFPNSISIQAFLKRNWIQLDTNKYFLKPQWSLRLLLALKDIRKGFVSHASNYEQTKGDPIGVYEQFLKGKVDVKVNRDYLNYRFFNFPHGHYLKAEQKNDLAVARLGQRGKLKELQLLHVNMEIYNKAGLKVLIKELKRKAGGVDLVSCPAGADGTMCKLLKAMGFRAAPNKGNICYKVLDKKVFAPMEQLELEAINFHTY